jgi:phosphotransferase system HPr-like phosphotransfer protein
MLSSINDVKIFVTAASSLPCDIDVVSGRYVVDAKSIMGLFSIDLSKAIQVDIHGTEADISAFEEKVSEFTVK